MNLAPQYIDIPKELMNLAAKMPDALDILKLSNNQSDTPILNE
jgi:hypothetical protein